MRFILLARERTTGVVRPLSERAFDSQSAAVDAATVTAHSIDLRDDEVFAVDLDQAGPVLVLRIEVPAREAPARPEPVVARPWSWMSPAAPEVPDASVPSAGETPSPTREPEPEVFASEIVLRLQPRYPLFAAQEGEAEPETSASILGAPTDDRYSAEDGPELLDAREESRLLADAADVLFDSDAIQQSEAIDFRMSNGDALRASSEDALPVSEADAVPVSEGDAIPVSMGDALPVSEGDVWPDALPAADEVAEEPVAEVAEMRPEDVAEEPVEALLVEEIDIEYDLGPEAPEEYVPEEIASAELIVADILPPEEDLPAQQDLPLEQDLPEEAPAARAIFAEPEPEPYRASNTNFAVWVCADCVYQRTCRKAGVATPATCGNFQWRSF
jgi:hypothetical protein